MIQRKDVLGVSAGDAATDDDASSKSDKDNEKDSTSDTFGNKSQVLNLFTIDVDRYVLQIR